MTWFTESANEDEADKTHCQPFVAVDMEFSSGHIRLWTGAGNLTLSGNVYSGIGDMGSIESDSETAELLVQKRKYVLSGVDPALVDESDIDDSHGYPIITYLGFLNPETKQLIGDPELLFEDDVDNVERKDGPAPTITINAQSRLRKLNIPGGLRYTQEHQQRVYPSGGDNGYDQVVAIQMKTIVWGGKLVDPAVPTSIVPILYPGSPGGPYGGIYGQVLRP